MTIASVGTLGTALSSGNNQTSLVLTTSAAAEVGNLVILAVAVDNDQTTDGDSTAVSGVVDSSGGNTWIKAKSFANGQGAAQAGADCSIWYTVVRTQIANGGTITASFTSATTADASAMSAWEFTKDPASTISIEGTPGSLANDGANAGALDVTTANIAALRVRAIASESNSSTALTPTAGGWAIITQAISGAGTSATEMGIRGEWRIATGTSFSSAPTGGAGAVDHASVYVAFKEVPTYGSWLTTPGQVVRRAGLAAAVLASGAFYTPQHIVAAATPDLGWYRAFDTPQRRVVTPLSETFNPVPFDRGIGSYAPLELPARARTAPRSHVFDPVAVPASLSWYVPQADPQRVLARPASQLIDAIKVDAAQPGTGTAFPSGVSGPPSSVKRFQYQASAKPVLVPAAAETITPDKWFAPLGEPVRVRVTIGPQLQQATAFVQAAPFNEAVSLDKWLAPLAEPVRVKPALLTGAQQSFAFVKADPFPETTDPGKWHRPLGEPSVKRRAAVAQQQSVIFAQPEDVTVGKWLTPFSEPQRSRPALRTASQQHVAFVQASPFAETVSADRWAQPLSQPTRSRPQTQPVAVSYAQYVDAAVETVTLDKWHRSFSDPVRKLGLPTAEQQSFAFVKADPFAESVSVDRWLQPLDQPTLAKRKTQPDAVSFVAPQVITGWQQPFDRPTLRRGLPTAQQQTFAFVQAAPFAETVSVDRWLRALSEPRWSRRPVAYQLPATFWPYPLPNVDAPVGVYSIYPDRTRRNSLLVAQQQYLAFVKAAPFAESVSVDRWLRALSEPPVKARVSIAAAQQQSVIVAPAVDVSVAGWLRPLSEPRRSPRSSPHLRAVELAPFPVPAAVSVDCWLQALSQPAGRGSVRYSQVILAPVVPQFEWFVPLAVPRQRARGGVPYPAFALWPLLEIAPETITLDKWFVEFSRPTLRTYTNALHQSASIYVLGPVAADPSVLVPSPGFDNAATVRRPFLGRSHVGHRAPSPGPTEFRSEAVLGRSSAGHREPRVRNEADLRGFLRRPRGT